MINPFATFGDSTWYQMYFVEESRTQKRDVQWHTSTQEELPRFFAQYTTESRPVTGTANRSEMDGSYTCHRGKATGYSCGTVSTIYYKPTYSNACPGDCDATWIKVSGPDLECYPGDSGGPWFFSTTAYGIYKGQASSGTSAADCDYAFFMAIGYIDALNVHVEIAP